MGWRVLLSQRSTAVDAESQKLATEAEIEEAYKRLEQVNEEKHDFRRKYMDTCDRQKHHLLDINRQSMELLLEHQGYHNKSKAAWGSLNYKAKQAADDVTRGVSKLKHAFGAEYPLPSDMVEERDLEWSGLDINISRLIGDTQHMPMAPGTSQVYTASQQWVGLVPPNTAIPPPQYFSAPPPPVLQQPAPFAGPSIAGTHSGNVGPIHNPGPMGATRYTKDDGHKDPKSFGRSGGDEKAQSHNLPHSKEDFGGAIPKYSDRNSGRSQGKGWNYSKPHFTPNPASKQGRKKRLPEIPTQSSVEGSNRATDSDRESVVQEIQNRSRLNSFSANRSSRMSSTPIHAASQINIPKMSFSGDYWRGFITQFETVAEKCGWTEAEMLDAFPLLLKKEALEYYSILPKEKNQEFQVAQVQV